MYYDIEYIDWVEEKEPRNMSVFQKKYLKKNCFCD